ncbi:MAG: HDOD domain-containing protein [Rhodocyclales bacterium GT-UBC]|nr:MAG: HDOD domain-containing protein [Rhodocyclales bacterium GT-UBC]
MSLHLNESEVRTRAINLPAFPRVVNDILGTLEDENATLGALARFVECDPVITARIVSAANAAAMGGHTAVELKNVKMAISLIGMSRVREIVLAVSMAEFARKSGISAYYWEHSVAVAITAQELGRFSHASADYALVAGLLHDIGQLWMARFYPLEFQMVRNAVNVSNRSIIEIEQHYFGIDHCLIGGILAEQWALPASIVAAVRHHHDPGPQLSEKLVALIHVAEVLSNALDLTSREENQVSSISEGACAAIGLDWEQDMSVLFGRIEARTEFACRVFR